MADREDEDLQMAIRMSLQESSSSSPSLPDAKRSKPIPLPPPDESPEHQARRLQRELRAAAAEKRMRGAMPLRPAPVPSPAAVAREEEEDAGPAPMEGVSEAGELISAEDAEQLWSMVFGDGVSGGILAQWSNQGIRFSSDPETCMGLVQHEGGPCGVLAAIQAFVLKYLIFSSDDVDTFDGSSSLRSLGVRKFRQRTYATDGFISLTEDRKARALVNSMVEILFACGSSKRAVVATLSIFDHHSLDGSQRKEMIGKALEGLSIASASDMHKVLRVTTYTSQATAFQRLITELPIFESRMGAMLFLLSALLSRGLESVQTDRDDPSLPLVTAPFGHASQEIVNLLLCGRAVPNVFDGRMDLGGGMSLEGIPASVEVGFLTLLESLNFCKVGQFLKCPKWPIWVIGSESHYTVLFALDSAVQEENKLEERESVIRKAFDAQDQSDGGGFISVEGFKQILLETNINFPADKLNNLCSAEIIVWNDFWQALLELDRSSGGMKDLSGSMGKEFDVYHFNGIAKSVLNGSAAVTGGESPIQRPRLCKLSVSVPPRWTQEEFLADVVPASCSSDPSGKQDGVIEVNRPEPPQHAPLVDCIRTRWPRAVCRWVGDAPSIV